MKTCPPSDYKEVLKRGNTKNWVYKFHDPKTIKTLTFDSEDLEWMKRAVTICCLTREWSNLFDDELAYTLDKYKKWVDLWSFQSDSSRLSEPPNKVKEGLKKGREQEEVEEVKEVELSKQVGWFIRTEKVSLKNGQFGPGPYFTLEKVIKSLVSSNPTHRCIDPDDETLTLYFFPFISGLDHMKEFRIFVFNNEITAISQQSLYNQNPWLTKLDYDDRLIPLIRQHILEPYETMIKPRMANYLSTYTMDFGLIKISSDEYEGEILNNEIYKPYFIEPNCYGAEYAAGSSLFGWIQDKEVLEDSASIEFRYTIASLELL